VRAVATLAAIVVALGAVGMIPLGLFTAGLVPCLVALTVPARVLFAVGLPGLTGLALAPRFPLTLGFALVLGFAFTVGTLAFAPVIAVVVPASKIAGRWGHRVAIHRRRAAVDISGLLIHTVAGGLWRVVRVARNHGAARGQCGKRNGRNNAGKRVMCHGGQILALRMAFRPLRKAREKRPGGVLQLRGPAPSIRRLAGHSG
jgi:hypothetical protein